MRLDWNLDTKVKVKPWDEEEVIDEMMKHSKLVEEEKFFPIFDGVYFREGRGNLGIALAVLDKLGINWDKGSDAIRGYFVLLAWLTDFGYIIPHSCQDLTMQLPTDVTKSSKPIELLFSESGIVFTDAEEVFKAEFPKADQETVDDFVKNFGHVKDLDGFAKRVNYSTPLTLFRIIHNYDLINAFLNRTEVDKEQ